MIFFILCLMFLSVHAIPEAGTYEPVKSKSTEYRETEKRPELKPTEKPTLGAKAHGPEKPVEHETKLPVEVQDPEVIKVKKEMDEQRAKELEKRKKQMEVTEKKSLKERADLIETSLKSSTALSQAIETEIKWRKDSTFVKDPITWIKNEIADLKTLGLKKWFTWHFGTEAQRHTLIIHLESQIGFLKELQKIIDEVVIAHAKKSYNNAAQEVIMTLATQTYPELFRTTIASVSSDNLGNLINALQAEIQADLATYKVIHDEIQKRLPQESTATKQVLEITEQRSQLKANNMLTPAVQKDLDARIKKAVGRQ